MARKGKGSDPIGKHAKHGSAPLPGDSAEEQRAAQRVVGAKASHGAPASDEAGHGASRVAAHGSHDAGNPAATPVTTGDFSAFAYDEEGRATEEVPEYLYKSRRMRRILIVVIVILVLLLGVGGVLVFQLFSTVQNAATQQAQTASEAIDVKQASEVSESSTTAKRTTVPDLVSLLGLTQDEAIEKMAHGAQVSSSSEVNEEGNPIKHEVRVALTAEPADSRTGTPTVYLGLDQDGRVIQAGYSTSTSSLGYGSFSFSDAVENVGVVEETLNEAGLQVPEKSVTLPEDKMEYSSYASDGTTLTREYFSFEGVAPATGGGAERAWSAVLSYDYTLANTTGNLADTMRTIYVYVGEHV